MSDHGRVILYARVSTEEQKLDLQEDALTEWARRECRGSFYQLVTDEMTGTTMDRPGWNQVEQRIEDGNVDTIVIWKMDRLGRGTIALLQLIGRLKEKEINLISLTDGFDLYTPMGNLLITILAGVAEWETSIRAERTKAGQDAYRAAGGEYPGRKKGTLNKSTRKKKSRILAMLGTKRRFEEIAKEAGVSIGTVRKFHKEQLGRRRD